MSFRICTSIVAFALTSALAGAQAQPAQDQQHTAHHPGEAAPAKQPAMGQPGRHPMMQMMRAMMADHGAEGQAAMMQPRHIEGRIAFLKTELKITDAQSQQWTAFAAALRESAKAMLRTRDQMMDGAASGTAPDLVQREVKFLSARLESAKMIAATETALYSALSDEQKKTADELLSTPMGRM
jgi:LTXXQ motif family protein